MDLLNSFLDKLKLESTKKLELSKKYQDFLNIFLKYDILKKKIKAPFP